MKKLIFTISCLMCVMNICIASAGDIPACAVRDIHAHFERYASFTMNEEGLWEAYNTDGVRMLAEAEAGSVKNSMNNGAVLLIPSVRGDAQRSYTQVVLHAYVFRYSPVNVQGISIVTGGVRYDIVTGGISQKVGIYACERIDIPLDETGLEMLKSISENGCSIYVYGSGKPFIAEVSADDGLTAVRSLLAELPEEYSDGYCLWNENAARWPDDRKLICSASIDGSDEYDAMLIKPFDIMDVSVRENVKLLQGMLAERGFYAGQQDGKYGEGTRSAVIAAQRYYGLTQTGIPDRQLLECLAENTPAEEASYTAESVLTDYGVVQLSLDGYWFADCLTPVAGMHSGSDILPYSPGNTLLIADGMITNSHCEEVNLPIIMSAELVLDGKYRYPCTIRCEKTGTVYYSTSLIPLEQARLLIYAEVPAKATEIADRKLMITIYSDSGEITVEHDLK